MKRVSPGQDLRSLLAVVLLESYGPRRDLMGPTLQQEHSVHGENRQHGRGRWQDPSAVYVQSQVGVDVV